MVLTMLFYGITLLWHKHSPERAFTLRRNWLAYFGHPILNIHVEVTGGPILEPALYVSNHRSFADPVVLCRYLDAYVIAKAEVASYPVINKGAELTGVLYVKRDDSKSRNEVRDLMVQTIKKGYNVLVYPEGTVGIQSKTLPFRVGSFMEAARCGIPVVPIAIEYRSEKDLWLIPNFLRQYLAQFAKWKTEVRLCFGEPLYSADGNLTKEQAYNWINAKKAELRKDWCLVDFTKFDHKEPPYQSPIPKSHGK